MSDTADAYSTGGIVHVGVHPEFYTGAYAELSPDEARLLALKIIRAADTAEESND